MSALLFAMPGNAMFCQRIAEYTNLPVGTVDFRRFPDGESYLRFETDVAGHHIILIDTLDRPDEKTLPLFFAARAARDLGAVRLGLVAPYLAYMRQDTRFRPGEAITSNYFASLVSQTVDWIVTVDPHLHRRTSMSEIYAVPVKVCHAAPVLSRWIKANVPDAVVIGPDVESEQWVAAVADSANAPHITLKKTRLGDRDVKIEFPDLHRWQGRSPVLVDDIVSSGRTMEVAVRQLRQQGFVRPICVAVHGLFAENAYPDLIEAGASQVVSTNTVEHPSNKIDVSQLVAEAMSEFLTS